MAQAEQVFFNAPLLRLQAGNVGTQGMTELLHGISLALTGLSA